MNAVETTSSNRQTRVDHRRSHRVDQAAERRSADDGDTRERRRQREGARQRSRPHERRHDRLLRRHLQRPRHAQRHAQRQDQVATYPAAMATPREHQGDHGLNEKAHRQYLAPVCRGPPASRPESSAAAPAGTASGPRAPGPTPGRSGRTSATPAQPSASGWPWCRAAGSRGRCESRGRAAAAGRFARSRSRLRNSPTTHRAAAVATQSRYRPTASLQSSITLPTRAGLASYGELVPLRLVSGSVLRHPTEPETTTRRTLSLRIPMFAERPKRDPLPVLSTG